MNSKRLEAMRRNPRGDWRIEDVAAVCREFGVECSPPKRGSHAKVWHPAMSEILTIPIHKPIKPVYLRLLVAYIDAVRSANA